MTDPKFDELTPDAASKDVRESELGKGQRKEGAQKPRAGLSINDTIAGQANMSVGGRGVDVSGVSSGAGAGAGGTNLTPGDAGGGSPAPTIVPGSQSTGMTPRGITGTDEIPTTRLDRDASSPSRDEVAERAYHCWHQRGCPHGSPEIDWDRAEQELRDERSAGKSAAASAGRER